MPEHCSGVVTIARLSNREVGAVHCHLAARQDGARVSGRPLICNAEIRSFPHGLVECASTRVVRFFRPQRNGAKDDGFWSVPQVRRPVALPNDKSILDGPTLVALHAALVQLS
jgi:hypothetical protein